jgi:hypothetical protein
VFRLQNCAISGRQTILRRLEGSDSLLPLARVAAPVKTGDNQKGIGLNKKEALKEISSPAPAGPS